MTTRRKTSPPANTRAAYLVNEAHQTVTAMIRLAEAAIDHGGGNAMPTKPSRTRQPTKDRA